MSKIKLLILLLINFIVISCLKIQEENELKFSLDYIGGGYDGLMLSQQLQKHLNNFNMLNQNSKMQIQGIISHSNNLFITNIDNTSDREKITSSIELKIFDKEVDCYKYLYSNKVSQFYVLASSDKFMSNKSAVEKIKVENIDYFVRDFMNNLNSNNMVCNE